MLRFLARSGLAVVLASAGAIASAQPVIYQETFSGSSGGWTAPGTPLGPEGVQSNLWYAHPNSYEAYVAPPGCSAFGGPSSNSISIGQNPAGLAGNTGANYDAGGLCGILTCPLTHRRTESPSISAAGAIQLTLSFDAVVGGEPPNDQASVWYFDGTTWSLLSALPRSSSVGCASGGAQWQAFSFVLPSSADHNPAIRVGFVWQNNDDGVGTDPSVAIGNIKITGVTVPGAPTNVQAVRSGDSAQIAWNAPADNGGPITGYTVTTQPSGLGCSTSGSPPPTSCTIGGLPRSSNETIFVIATNAVGDGPPGSVLIAGIVVPVPGLGLFGLVALILLILGGAAFAIGRSGSAVGRK
mgnify:CR=1 FL=1